MIVEDLKGISSNSTSEPTIIALVCLVISRRLPQNRCALHDQINKETESPFIEFFRKVVFLGVVCWYFTGSDVV